MKRYPLVLAFSIAAAWAADNDPATVLQRVTAKVLARMAALPNYTCVETVTRDYSQSVSADEPKACAASAAPSKENVAGLPAAPSLLWTMTDRLRLDVTITQRGEIYSWVGASKFEDGTIDSIVKQGPIASGAFGALLLMIFKQDGKTFRFSKYLLDGGRSLMEYSFDVNKADSHYQVKVGDAWAATAYSGTFQADPETAEVVRITLQTVGPPPAGIDDCLTTTAMEFNLMRIGDGEFLLPKGATQRYVSRTGQVVDNLISLTSCREYVGESTVSFSAAPEVTRSAGAAVAAPSGQLPAGLPFTLELTAPISTDTAGAGDSFAARLVNPLRDKSGKTLAPAHALVEGRVVLMEIRHNAPLGAVMVLKPMTIEIAGVKTPLAAIRKSGSTSRGKESIHLPQSWEPNSGIFAVSGTHPALNAGFQSDWVTLAAAAPAGSKKNP